ncbi:MAG TPA: Hsp20/alpha crystallin family protein [Chthonomonadaceae bacterium]|nr:Hsp20/alpha crystallin family protein [Chthonomonadaceae bacterium]
MNPTRFDRDALETLMHLPNEMFGVMNPRAAQPREHVSSRVWSPPVDVYEDKDSIVLKVELPGVQQNEIDIEMAGETLTIRGERKFEDEARRENYIRIERQYGAFQRSFTIGIPIEEDKVKATYRNGILEITIPKSEATKPKKVQVAVE